LGHSTSIIGISQILVVRVKIQVPVKVQPGQTQRYSQFIILKIPQNVRFPPLLHISLSLNF